MKSRSTVVVRSAALRAAVASRRRVFNLIRLTSSALSYSPKNESSFGSRFQSTYILTSDVGSKLAGLFYKSTWLSFVDLSDQLKRPPSVSERILFQSGFPEGPYGPEGHLDCSLVHSSYVKPSEILSVDETKGAAVVASLLRKK